MFCNLLLPNKITCTDKLCSTIIKKASTTNDIASNNKNLTLKEINALDRKEKQKPKLYFFKISKFEINLFKPHQLAQKKDCFYQFCLNNFHDTFFTRINH